MAHAKNEVILLERMPLLIAILLYSAVVSVFTFFVFGWDKSAAKQGHRRVPEKALFTLALVGGCPGAIAGMHILRHKTKHIQFRLGLPAILVFQTVLVLVILFG